MTDLRKLSNHPLLMRYHYDLNQLKEIAKLLAKDPGYKDTVVEYIVEDLKWMSDFEIHTMSQQFVVIQTTFIKTLSKYKYKNNIFLVFK